MKTRQAILLEPGRIELTDVELRPGPHDVLVKVAACGLCNWELNHWHGKLGKCPQSLGHEWSGKIVEAGSEVNWLKPGDAVTGLPPKLFGFSEYMVLGASNCLKLDEHVNPEHALGEPLKCIVTVLRAAAPEPGDCGIIVGCGPMGLWCIQALSKGILGRLIAVDVSPEKLRLAHKFGATHVVNPKEGNAAELIGDITGGHMADFLIEGTGVPEVVNQAVLYLKTGRGRYVMMSSHERPAEGFDWRPVQDKGVIVKGAHPAFSADQADDMRRAANMINNGVFKMDGVITHKFPLDDIQRAFETLERKPSDYIKGIVVP